MKKMKGHPTLKWAALQAGEKSGLPFLTEEGNFTPEFSAFWQMFEYDICKFEQETRRRFLSLFISGVSLVVALISLLANICVN